MREKISQEKPQHAFEHVDTRYRKRSTKDASRLSARRDCFELMTTLGILEKGLSVFSRGEYERLCPFHRLLVAKRGRHEKKPVAFCRRRHENHARTCLPQRRSLGLLEKLVYLIAEIPGRRGCTLQCGLLLRGQIVDDDLFHAADAARSKKRRLPPALSLTSPPH